MHNKKTRRKHFWDLRDALAQPGVHLVQGESPRDGQGVDGPVDIQLTHPGVQAQGLDGKEHHLGGLRRKPRDDKGLQLGRAAFHGANLSRGRNRREGVRERRWVKEREVRRCKSSHETRISRRDVESGQR